MLIAEIKKKAKISQTGISQGGIIAKKFENISSNLKSTPTIISNNVEIDGEIRATGLVEIEGRIKGVVAGGSITIREKGSVEGEINSNSVNIRGIFRGKIKAKNITICSKSSVHGNIEYETLCVEDGASIEGEFKKIDFDCLSNSENYSKKIAEIG